MQNNLIKKIENLYKLKNLEYLNLALNNIEKIENLNMIESLKKLDLTLNFIGHLTSIENLKNNRNLTELILTGNPCTQFEGYREFVIFTLPQLHILDGIEILRTNKIIAKQDESERRKKIMLLEIDFSIERNKQKKRLQIKREKEEQDNNGLDEEEINRRYLHKLHNIIQIHNIIFGFARQTLSIKLQLRYRVPNHFFQYREKLVFYY